MQVTAVCTCVSRAVPLKPEQSLRRTASLKPRRSRRFFSKRTLLRRFKQIKGGSLLGISRNLNVFPRAERQEAAKQALAFVDEETRSRILWTTLGETTHLARISALSPFSNRRRVACAGTGRNVLSCALVRMQRRRKVRTWTSTSLDDFGFHQDPQQDGVE